MTFRGDVDFSIDPTFVDSSTHRGELARSRVLPGDVLMNIVGPPLGKVGVVPSDYPEWNMNQAIAVFRTLPGLERSFLAAHLLSARTVQWAVQAGKATAGQLNLTLEICRDIPVPLAPAGEQRAILARLANAEAKWAHVRECTDAVQTALGTLESTVLRRAFRGDLVPQDPNDEPDRVDVVAEYTVPPKHGRTLGKK